MTKDQLEILVQDLAKLDPVVEFKNPTWKGCVLCWETGAFEHRDDCPWLRAQEILGRPDKLHLRKPPKKHPRKPKK